MKLPAYSLMETVVALALSSMLAVGALQGVELLWSGVAAVERDDVWRGEVALASEMLRHDLWLAQRVTAVRQEDSDAPLSVTLVHDGTEVRWYAEADTLTVRRATRGARAAVDRFEGELSWSRSDTRLYAQWCPSDRGKVLEAHCVRESTSIR